MFRKYALYIALLACLYACTPGALHEAQYTVSQADSLWNAGQTYNDSLALAQAYRTLGYWRWFYPDNYVHACYHYGRLLRQKDDPATAMNTFVNATHTRSHDYHILGRVYSNMGSICHLANEFSLSYDMYDRSASYFLKNGDTLNYFYALNDMAYELAEQGKKEEAFSLITSIRTQCDDSYVLIKTLETQADAYWRAQQYDSAIYSVKELNAIGYKEPTTTLIMAQSYDELHQKDSALLLANAILEDSYASYQNKFNALYIILHCDSSLCAEDINALASQREDIRYYDYEPLKIKLTNAILILEQDLAQKPDFTWLIAIFVTIIVIACMIGLYVKHKHKKHALLAQKIEHLEVEYNELQTNKKSQVKQTCSALCASENLQNVLSWKDFDKMCNFVNEHFYLLANKLFRKNVLNETEIRLCVLVLIGLNRTEIAKTLPYALNSVGKLKDHTAKSLGTTGKNLREFLLQLAIEG